MIPAKIGKAPAPFFNFLLQATVLSRILPVDTGADECHGATSIVQRRLVGESVDALAKPAMTVSPRLTSMCAQSTAKLTPSGVQWRERLR